MRAAAIRRRTTISVELTDSVLNVDVPRFFRDSEVLLLVRHEAFVRIEIEMVDFDDTINVD